MAKATFNKAFDRIETTIAFNPDWKNGTGYLNGAVVEKGLKEICKTVDDFGRRVIIIPLCIGNVVVFERYSEPKSDVIVSNAPVYVKKLAFGLDLGTNLHDKELAFYLGDEFGNPHIGERLNDFLSFANKLNK